MKKFFIILLTLLMCVTMCSCAMQNEDGSPTVFSIAVQEGIGLVATIMQSALLVAGTWLLGTLGKQTTLKNITTATAELITLTRQTVGELQQVFVDEWKASSKDGKLSPEQIKNLRDELLRLVNAKLDVSTKNLIEAAGADINALIIGEAESWINYLKPIEIAPVEQEEIGEPAE